MAWQSPSSDQKPPRPASLWATVTSYARLLFHPDTPKTVKVVLALAIVYFLSPFDLLPDWLGPLGFIDDVAVVSLLVGWAIRLADRRNQGEKTNTK